MSRERPARRRRAGALARAAVGVVATLAGAVPALAQSTPPVRCPLPIAEQREAARAFRALLPVFQHSRCAGCHGALNVFAADTPHEGGFMAESIRMTDPFTMEKTIDIRVPHPDRQRDICVECHDEAAGEWRQQTGGDVQWAGQPPAELCRRMKTTPILTAVNTPGGLLAHLRDDPLVRLAFVGRSGGAAPTRRCPGGPDCISASHGDFLAGMTGWVEAVSEAGAWLGNPDCGCQPPEVEESVILVIDVSGSMNDHGKLGAAQEAARTVIAEFLGTGASAAAGAGGSTAVPSPSAAPPPSGTAATGAPPPVEFGILTYAGSCDATFPFTPFSQDGAELAAVVAGLSAGGGTPMTPALYQARGRIWREGSGKSGRIVLLTDGQNDCAGSAAEAARRIFEKREEDLPVGPRTRGPSPAPWWALLLPDEAVAAQTLAESMVDPLRRAMPITVSTIGFQVSDLQQAELDAIASAGGGVSLRAENASELAAAFRRAVGGPAVVVVQGGGGGGTRRSIPTGPALALLLLGLTAVAMAGALAVARARRTDVAAASGSAFPHPAAVARIDLSLAVHEPGGAVRSVRFRRAPVSIGRDPSNDLVLSDPAASRLHARIVVEDGRLWIEDLGSAAGVRIDGERARRGEVIHGRVLLLGETRISVTGPER